MPEENKRLDKYCKTLDQYINDCISKSNQIGLQTAPEEPYKFLITQVFHINGSLSSISLILKSVEESPHHLNQIHLILRNVFTIISLTYSAILESLNHNDNDNSLIDNINKINLDHYNSIEKFIGREARETLGWTQTEIKSELDIIKNERSKIKSFNQEFSTSTSRAFINIINWEKNPELKGEFCFLFERWDTFSKIEHPGAISLALFKSQFSKIIFKEDISDIIKTINFSIEQQLFYLSFCTQEEFDDLKSLYDKLKRL